MAHQDYDPREEQAQEGMRPGSISDSSSQAGEAPAVLHESFDRQDKPDVWPPAQQVEDTGNDLGDTMRSEQPEYRDQRQASDAEQA